MDKNSQKHFYDLLRKRDRKAMEYLYDHYSPVIFGLIMRIVRDESLAEKLMTKTFRHIWKNYKEFDPQRQNVCVWIINVTRKMCREEISFSGFTQHNEASAFSSLDKSKLSLSGSPLSIKCKKVFELFFFGNGSLMEVAKHTSMNEAEIKYNLREAFNQLKNIAEKV